jgi:hypothetical protein
MTIRKVRRVRVVRRRRRIYRRRRRIHRPIGSGDLAKRYFKLRTHVDANWVAMTSPTTGSQYVIVFNDNPSTLGEWQNFVPLFESYRVCAMKIRFIPSNMANLTAIFVPGYIYHDPNTSSAPTSITVGNALDRENCRVVNLQRVWTYYRKLRRVIRFSDPTYVAGPPIRVTAPPDSISLAGCLPVDAPTNTALIRVERTGRRT